VVRECNAFWSVWGCFSRFGAGPLGSGMPCEDALVDGKRQLDLVGGVALLVAAAPVMLGIALAMRATGDTGPVIYRARRVGERGSTFDVLKIRTMYANVGGAGLTGHRDRRVTPLGRILRRYRLDELPQLVNVVRGEMSLVGPRPEDPRFVDWSNPVHARVFSARPGITGLAQLEFHNEASQLVGDDVEDYYRRELLPAKLQLDLDYLERRSVRLDLQILARTLAAVLS
jgi:lipopolysaccharide/colanic/teichoic acid biosynthesis glycosyltransferase